MSRMKKSFIIAIGCLVLSASNANEPDLQDVEIHVADMTSRFMSFYEQAKDYDSAEKRFELWKERYNFVALPPGLSDRDARAREMLDDAWQDYPDVIKSIETATEDLNPEPILTKVADLLGFEEELPPVRLIYYVGMFDGNAFFAPQPDGTLVVALPVEEAPGRLELSMAHEFVHALHFSASGPRSGPESNVAALVLSEGMAMHASRELMPNWSVSDYMGSDGEWVERCNQRIESILIGIEGSLNESGQESLNRFTMGDGNSGMKREAYCAGWHLVDRLLGNGHEYSEIAKSKSPEDLLRQAMALE